MLITPRETPTKDLEERVVVGPEERREALLDLSRQPLVVVRAVNGPADALVERREGFGYFFPHGGFRNIFSSEGWLRREPHEPFYRSHNGWRVFSQVVAIDNESTLPRAPFFRPMAQTGALFARAVVCATVMSSARVLSIVLLPRVSTGDCMDDYFTLPCETCFGISGSYHCSTKSLRCDASCRSWSSNSRARTNLSSDVQEVLIEQQELPPKRPPSPCK